MGWTAVLTLVEGRVYSTKHVRKGYNRNIGEELHTDWNN